jgi:crossover junction endodeoxyribonuclease RusA
MLSTPVKGGEVKAAPSSFEFCVQGPAVSARAKDRGLLRNWIGRVASAARAAWPPASPPLEEDLTVSISEFSLSSRKDRDNLAKPVLDAMEGIVYANDRQIKRLHVDWRAIDGRFVVRYMSPVVAASFSIGEEFLWVRVSPYVASEELVR